MSRSGSGGGYTPTEAKYKDGADEYYVTYDLPQKTRGDGEALYPKVRRVYIAGRVVDADVGRFEKRTGKKIFGMEISFEQGRKAYTRKGYTARRGDTTYRVKPGRVPATKQQFTKYIELPAAARNIHLHSPNRLPRKYRSALQDVR